MVKESWKKIKLGELGTFLNGVNFKRSAKGSGYKLINVKDLFRGHIIDFSNLDRVNLEEKKNLKKYFVKEGDLFFSRSSVKREGVAVVNMAKKSDDKTVHCGFIIRFRIEDSSVDNVYITYLLRGPIARKRLINISGGAAIINVTQDTLSKFEIEIPEDIKEQQKIASILSNYDDLIENNTKRIELLEKIATLIYDEWFVKFRFPGQEKTKFVNSELGKIPEGWEVNDVQNVIDVIGGGTPSTKIKEYWNPEEINWYVPKDLTNINSPFSLRSGTKISKLGLQKSSAKLFPPFSVMMTSRATVGVVGINITNAAVNQGFIVCAPNEAMPYTYIYFWLKQNVPNLIQLGGGTTFKEVTKTTFRQYQILIPPINLMSQFHELILSIFQEILNIIRKQDNLIKTRDLLLLKLISGQVDVSDLDIKVPERQEVVV